VIQLTQSEYDKLRANRKEAKRLRGIIDAINSWAVRAQFLDPDDMADNFSKLVKITSPNYAGEGE